MQSENWGRLEAAARIIMVRCRGCLGRRCLLPRCRQAPNSILDRVQVGRHYGVQRTDMQAAHWQHEHVKRRANEPGRGANVMAQARSTRAPLARNWGPPSQPDHTNSKRHFIRVLNQTFSIRDQAPTYPNLGIQVRSRLGRVHRRCVNYQ